MICRRFEIDEAAAMDKEREAANSNKSKRLKKRKRGKEVPLDSQEPQWSASPDWILHRLVGWLVG
jgi:hypothetical protein